ncbi:MAG: DUF429 domain-containing protein [Pseudomonadota bacterium]
MIVHGVDGCPSGYAVVTLGDSPPCASVIPTIAPLFDRGETVAIDIPIGLPASICGPGRPPEQAIRPLLGPRRSSVFSIPCRDAVFAPTYAEACAAARAASTPPKAISIQAFKIFPKIREVDAALTPATEAHVFEVHAELGFWRLNGERPMAAPKAARGVPTAQQLASRITLLTAHGLPASLFENRPAALPLVDLVDAAAIALIAQRCAAGTAVPFPDPPPRDARGLRMAIWA